MDIEAVKQSTFVEESVAKIIERILNESDLGDMVVVDVEYVKEKDRYLRVFIDKPGGIDIEDCEKLSRLLEKELDEKDLIPDAYILEVSSPGLDRPLKKPKDFLREMGKRVDVSFYAPVDGKKLIVGSLTGYDGETLTLDENKRYPIKDIAKVQLSIDI